MNFQKCELFSGSPGMEFLLSIDVYGMSVVVIA